MSLLTATLHVTHTKHNYVLTWEMTHSFNSPNNHEMDFFWLSFSLHPNELKSA